MLHMSSYHMLYTGLYLYYTTPFFITMFSYGQNGLRKVALKRYLITVCLKEVNTNIYSCKEPS